MDMDVLVDDYRYLLLSQCRRDPVVSSYVVVESSWSSIVVWIVSIKAIYTTAFFVTIHCRSHNSMVLFVQNDDGDDDDDVCGGSWWNGWPSVVAVSYEIGTVVVVVVVVAFHRMFDNIAMHAL